MASKEATDLSTQTPTEKYSSWNSSDPSEETNVTLSDSYITTVSYSSLGSHFERPENAHLYALQPGLRTVWSRSVQDFASEDSAIQRTTRSHSLEHNLNKRVPSVPNVFQGRDMTLRTHQKLGQSAPIQSETPLYKRVEQTQIDSNKKAPFSKVALPVQRIKAVKHCGELFEATYLPIEVLRREEKLLAKWEPASYQPVLSVMYLYGQKMRCDLPILEPIFAAPPSLSTVHGRGRDTRYALKALKLILTTVPGRTVCRRITPEPPPCDRESDTRIRLRKLEKELETARHRALIPSITSGSAYSRRAQGRKFKEVYHVLGDDHLTDSNVVDMFKEVYGDSALSSQSSCSSSTLRPSRIPVLPLPQGGRSNNNRSMHHYRARGQLRVAAGGDAITSPNYDSSLCATFDVDDEFTDLAHLNSDCNWDEENSPVKHSNKDNLARVHQVRPHTETHRLCGLERHMDTTQGRTTNGTFTHSTNLPTTDTLSYSSNPSPVSRDAPHFQMPPRRHTIGNQMDKCEIPRNVEEGVRVANFAGLSAIPQLSSKRADVVINPSNINIKEHERRTEMPSSIVRCVPTKALLSAINGEGDLEELKNKTKDAEFRVGECFDEEGEFLSDSDADTASTSETITPYQTDATEAISGTYSTRTGMMRDQIAEALQQMNLPEGRESRLHTSQSVSTHYSLMRSFGGKDGVEDDLMVRSLDHLNYESETLRTMPHVDVSAIPYLMHSPHHSMDSVYPAQSFFMNKFPSASVPCLSVSDAPRASLEHSDTLHRIPQANLHDDVYEGSIWESQNTESLRSPMYGTRTRKCKSMDSVLASDMKGKSGAVCSVSEVFDTIMLEDQMKKQEAWDTDEQIFSYKDGRSLEGTSKKGKFNNYFSMLIFKIFPAWFRMLSCRSRRARPQTDSDGESVDS